MQSLVIEAHANTDRVSPCVPIVRMAPAPPSIGATLGSVLGATDAGPARPNRSRRASTTAAAEAAGQSFTVPSDSMAGVSVPVTT